MSVNSQGFLLHWGLSSDLAEVDSVCLEIREFFTTLELKVGSFVPELLTREFLNNAVIHGNRSQTEKLVAITVKVGRKWIRIRITDEGAGFDWRKMRNTPPEDRTTESRGLPIGAIYASRITFNRKGNQVTIWLDKEGKGV